jgi:hypothetical protein
VRSARLRKKKRMKRIEILAVLVVSALEVVPAHASTQPLPATFQGSTTDYISFDGNSFPGSNLICVQAGCGGAFQATVYGPNSVSANGPSVLTSVWCVDYQLDVTYGSQYIGNITTLNDINPSTESNVRYGTLDSTDTASGWVNGVTAPNGVDANSSAYRYTLAAALTSQYIDSGNVADPTNPNGGSPVNIAIQEAIWYVTYNNEYPANGTIWPPSGISPATCLAGQSATNSTGNADYACWVQYAEANSTTVNTSQWGVISGPANSQGVLQAPGPLNGVYSQYPSYQTFLVQVDSGGQITNQGVTPEPTYFALTFGLGALIILVRRRGARASALPPSFCSASPVTSEPRSPENAH